MACVFCFEQNIYIYIKSIFLFFFFLLNHCLLLGHVFRMNKQNNHLISDFKDKKYSLLIYQSSINPPHFQVVVKNNIYNLPKVILDSFFRLFRQESMSVKCISP